LEYLRVTNNKPRTVWESYWRQLNGCFTVFPIAKQYNNKTRTAWESYWRQLNGCCLQYDSQTVLVLLLSCFAIGNTVKQPFSCLQYDTQTVLVLLLFCFAIGNTVKQPFSCLQYDSQTVLVLLLFYRISNSKAKQ
jgi:uncharacterized integral membrane protein